MDTLFFKTTSVKETVDLMEQHKDGVVVVNGGSDIVEKISTGEVSPSAIIYVENVEGMKEIAEKDGNVVIGGAVTYKEMEQSEIIQKYNGLLVALHQLGSPAIREVATPAGNVGTGAPSADCTTMLMGLGAKIIAVSAAGERVIPIEEFFVKTYKTVLQSNELIKEIQFPMAKAGDGSGYIKLARRKSQDIGKVLIGVSISVENDVCKAVKIGLGALNATAVRAYSLEEALVGMGKEEAVAYINANFPKEAGLRPSRFTRYKEYVTRAAIERAYVMAWDDAVEV